MQYGRSRCSRTRAAPTRSRKAIDRAGLTDISEGEAPQAYTRDPNRVAPHNLFSTTTAALEGGEVRADGAPDAVFTYADDLR